MSFQIFGGETLMKWREPNTRERKSIWLNCSIVFLFIMIVLVTKLDDKPVNIFYRSLILIVSAGYAIIVFFTPPSVRLMENCVHRQAGNIGRGSNYDKIESATVHHRKDGDKKISIIEFKLKHKPPFFPDASIQKVLVPENVNLDQVLQILRDKGVNVIEGHLHS